MKNLTLAIVGALSVLPAAAAPGAYAEPLRSFSVQERFGVSHPLQVIDFDLELPLAAGSVHVVDADGRPVAWQLLDSGRRLAVLTDLPAGATRTGVCCQARYRSRQRRTCTCRKASTSTKSRMV